MQFDNTVKYYDFSERLEISIDNEYGLKSALGLARAYEAQEQTEFTIKKNYIEKTIPAIVL